MRRACVLSHARLFEVPLAHSFAAPWQDALVNRHDGQRALPLNKGLSTQAGDHKLPESQQLKDQLSEHMHKARDLVKALRAVDPLGPPSASLPFKAVALQLQAVWQNHRNLVLSAGAVSATTLLWGQLHSLAVLLGAPDIPYTSYTSLAAAGTAVGGSALLFRSYFRLSGEAVFQQALLHLNTSAAVREVLGSPLVSVSTRAEVVSGQGWRWEGWTPHPRSARVQVVFPLRGSQRGGLVLAEGKRIQGRLVLKALAVDVPSLKGGEERIWLIGKSEDYHRGTVFSDLRQPFIKVLALNDQYQHEDELDAQQLRIEAEQKRLVAARRRAAQQALAAAKRGSSKGVITTHLVEPLQQWSSSLRAEVGGAVQKNVMDPLQQWSSGVKALVGRLPGMGPSSPAAAGAAAAGAGVTGAEAGAGTRAETGAAGTAKATGGGAPGSGTGSGGGGRGVAEDKTQPAGTEARNPKV